MFASEKLAWSIRQEVALLCSKLYIEIHAVILKIMYIGNLEQMNLDKWKIKK